MRDSYRQRIDDYWYHRNRDIDRQWDLERSAREWDTTRRDLEIASLDRRIESKRRRRALSLAAQQMRDEIEWLRSYLSDNDSVPEWPRQEWLRQLTAIEPLLPSAVDKVAHLEEKVRRYTVQRGESLCFDRALDATLVPFSVPGAGPSPLERRQSAEARNDAWSFERSTLDLIASSLSLLGSYVRRYHRD